MKILAVDPGKRTGLAWLDTAPLALAPGEKHAFGCVETDDLFEWWQRTGGWPDVVVCESYIITMQTIKKSRGENWALEIIGALRWECRRRGIPFILSPPAAKAFGSDPKLKALGWWAPGKGHAMDAARHLLVHLVEQKLIDPREFLLS